jgi:ThiF family
MFSPEEIERYARHIVLHGVGGPGQQKLKAARVLVIGAGGLGSPLIQYLAAAGVGEIGVLDDDEVSLSNLQRQVLHGTADIGRAKVESAKAAIERLNPHVRVTALPARLTADNARAMASSFDVVADGSDNFATRYAVSDAQSNLPLSLSGAASRGEGVGLVRGGCARRPDRHPGRDDGAGSYPRNRRFRRRACRQACARRCARHAFRDIALPVGSSQSTERNCRHRIIEGVARRTRWWGKR